VIGVAQGHDVRCRRRIAQRPERAPSELGDPIDEVRRQPPRVLVDALEPQRREHRDRGHEPDGGHVRHRRELEAARVIGQAKRHRVEVERVLGTHPADEAREAGH
jgi:hypothetical protein